MTSPLNYRGSRGFPQDILNHLDQRLNAIEASRPAADESAKPVTCTYPRCACSSSCDERLADGAEAAALSDEEILRDLIQHASEVSDHTPESFRIGVIRLASRARAILAQRDAGKAEDK